MAKKKVEPKTLGEAYKGTILTFIVTIFIISVGFFLPMITAKEIQDAMEGKGRYEPTDTLIWDLNSESDLYDVEYTSGQDERGVNHRSSTSCNVDSRNVPHSVWWKYKAYSTAYTNRWDGMTGRVEFSELEIEGTVDNSLTFPFTLDGGDTPRNLGDNILHNNEGVRLHFKVDSDTFIKNDATKIILFSDFDTSGIESSIAPRHRIEFRTENGYYIIQDWTYKDVGDSIVIDLDMSDLIGIASISGNEEYLFVWERLHDNNDDDFTYSTPYIFDLQIHGLQGKPNAITLLSVWYMIQAVLIFMLGFVMLPQISLGRLSGMLRLNKEW